jgi:hypothetical protein
MSLLSEMNGESLAAWVAGDAQDAVASPSELSSPPPDGEVPEGLAVEADAETPGTEDNNETPPDVDTLVAKLAELEAKQAEAEAAARREQEEAERQRAERDRHVAEQLRAEESARFRKDLAELHELDPDAARKIAQHRSFLEQDREYFRNEMVTNAKIADVLSLAIETLAPDQVEAITNLAATLMPYSSYDEMRTFLTTQRQQQETVQQEIARLRAEIAERDKQLAALQRDPNIDRVDRGSSGNGASRPGDLRSMNGEQLAEWAASVSSYL